MIKTIIPYYLFKPIKIVEKFKKTKQNETKTQLNLEEQFKLLKPFRIYPLHLRLFRHYCLFLYKLIKNGKAVYILSKVTRLEGRELGNHYSVPGFNLCARVVNRLSRNFFYCKIFKGQKNGYWIAIIN